METNLKFAFKLLKKFGLNYLIVSIVLSVFEFVAPLINVYGLKMILDSIQNGKSFNEILIFITWLFVLMLIAYVLGSWYKKKYSPIATQKISLKIRRYFYEKASQTDLKFFDDTDYYNTYVKALSESESRLFGLINELSGLVGIISCLITVITLAITMDGLILMFSFFSIFINVFISIIAQSTQIKEHEESVGSKRRAEYVNRIFYLRQYAKEVRSFSLKNTLLGILNDSSNKTILTIKKYIPKQFSLSIINSFFDIIYVLGMMTYLTYKTINGSITIGDFAALLTATQAFSSQAESLFNVIPKMKEHLEYIGYLKQFINNKSIIECDFEGKKMSCGEAPEIEIKNVQFKYPNSNNNVLKNITCDIKKGQMIAVVGENGVGKSTFFKLLLRLYDVTDGEIMYNGTSIKEYDLKSLRKNIGIVFQDFQHYALTIRENLCFDNNMLSDEVIFEALEKVGLKSKIERLPNGLDTSIGYEFDQNGIEFSIGEFQKLSLARALISKQGMIIMDEPSSSLDPNSEKIFLKNIKELCFEKTAFIITHNLGLARYANQIFLMKDGEIIEKGSHKELLSLQGEYAKMFNSQSEHYIAN